MSDIRGSDWSRERIVQAIANTVDMMGLVEEGETLAEATVKWGEDDKISLAEAKKYLYKNKKKAA